ncbi:MAG: hypothetical protein RTV31_02855 [Candidatus Thorarchaeota archaeon]
MSEISEAKTIGRFCYATICIVAFFTIGVVTLQFYVDYPLYLTLFWFGGGFIGIARILFLIRTGNSKEPVALPNKIS